MKITRDSVDPSTLRPGQNEIDAAKAGMMFNAVDERLPLASLQRPNRTIRAVSVGIVPNTSTPTWVWQDLAARGPGRSWPGVPGRMEQRTGLTWKAAVGLRRTA